MAYELEGPHSIAPMPITDKWIKAIDSWFRVWCEKRARKQSLHLLASHDERILEDIGLPRSELVRELGYDPSELPRLFGANAHINPYLWKENDISSDHVRRRP